GRHVWHQLRAQGRCTLFAGGTVRHRSGGAGGGDPALPGDPTGARNAADQPAFGHRWCALLAAGRRHHGFWHRVQDTGHPPRIAQCRRHEFFLGAHLRLPRCPGRSLGALVVSQAHLSGHGHPRHRPGSSGDRADGGGQPQALPRHLGDRRRPGRPRRRTDGAAVRHLPADRPAVRAADLHDLRAGWPWQHDRRLHRRLHHQPVHRRRLELLPHGMGICGRLPVLHGGDLHSAAGLVWDEIMTSLRPTPAVLVGIVAVAALPLVVRVLFPASEKYYLHLLIQILLWSFIYTGWSLMGRFGLTSLGHGAFTGIGAYATVLLWNYAGLTPWIGMLVGVLLATIVAVLVGYP